MSIIKLYTLYFEKYKTAIWLQYWTKYMVPKNVLTSHSDTNIGVDKSNTKLVYKQMSKEIRLQKRRILLFRQSRKPKLKPYINCVIKKYVTIEFGIFFLSIFSSKNEFICVRNGLPVIILLYRVLLSITICGIWM